MNDLKNVYLQIKTEINNIEDILLTSQLKYDQLKKKTQVKYDEALKIKSERDNLMVEIDILSRPPQYIPSFLKFIIKYIKTRNEKKIKILDPLLTKKICEETIAIREWIIAGNEVRDYYRDFFVNEIELKKQLLDLTLDKKEIEAILYPYLLQDDLNHSNKHNKTSFKVPKILRLKTEVLK